jgi:ClpP class serine protease
LAEMANGEPITGADAAKKGLVDETGYFEAAVLKAQSLAGLTSSAVVTYQRPPGLFDVLIGAQGPSLPAGQGLLPEQTVLSRYPKFYYMWTAGAGLLLSSAENPATMVR